MSNTMVRSLSALLAVLVAVQTSIFEVAAQTPLTAKQLRPIHLRQYEASFGLQRRASEQFSSLDPSTQSQLIYGSPLENEQLLLANMTLYAPDGLQLVLLEEFDHLTKAVDCNGDDGSMSLTFKDEDAFNYALKTWSYINEKEDSKFLVIANHEGCGPDDQRQPYLISSIKEDAPTLTTYFTAQPAPWSDVAGTYDMDFGKAIPFTRPNHLQSRGLWGDITGAVKGAVNDVKSGISDVVNGAKDVASDIGSVVTGNIDLSKSVSFGMNAGTPNQKTQLFTDNTHLTLDCINCYITGSIEVTGHISVEYFKLKDLSIDGTPHGLNGALEMEAQITKYEKPDSWKLTKELFSAPVPDAGIEIPGIFKLGAILSYEVGVQAQLQGSATLDFGLSLDVPDSAGIHVDVMDPTSSTAQGLTGDIKPLFDIKALSATIQLAAFAQPKLSFGIEITEVGELDVELVFKSPQLAVKFIAAYNESGLCSHEPGASKTGVEIQTQIGLELDLNLDASLGSTNNIKPSYWAKLWTDYHQLSSSCWPIAIPGLAVPGNSLTALPSQSAGAATGSASAANISIFTGSAYTAYTAPPISVPGLPTAAPLPGNGSRVIVPTGFLKSSVSGAPMATGTFSTNGQATGTGYPYPISSSNASSVLPSGSGFTRLPSGSGRSGTATGTGPATSGANPPFPIGSGSGLPIASSGGDPTGTGLYTSRPANSGFTKKPSSSGTPKAPTGRRPSSSESHPSKPTGPPPPPPTGSSTSDHTTPPMPTVPPPPPPTGTGAPSSSASPSDSQSKSHTRRPKSLSSSEHESHISLTKTKTKTGPTHATKSPTKAPFPTTTTNTENAGASTTGGASSGVASASHHRFRYLM